MTYTVFQRKSVIVRGWGQVHRASPATDPQHTTLSQPKLRPAKHKREKQELSIGCFLHLLLKTKILKAIEKFHLLRWRQSCISPCLLLLPKHILLWVFNPTKYFQIYRQITEFPIPSTNQLFHYIVEVKNT